MQPLIWNDANGPEPYLTINSARIHKLDHEENRLESNSGNGLLVLLNYAYVLLYSILHTQTHRHTDIANSHIENKHLLSSYGCRETSMHIRTSLNSLVMKLCLPCIEWWWMVMGDGEGGGVVLAYFYQKLLLSSIFIVRSRFRQRHYLPVTLACK